MLDLPGVQIEQYMPATGRASLAARLERRDKGARSPALLSHTDVESLDLSITAFRHVVQRFMT